MQIRKALMNDFICVSVDARNRTARLVDHKCELENLARTSSSELPMNLILVILFTSSRLETECDCCEIHYDCELLQSIYLTPDLRNLVLVPVQKDFSISRC